ncbi:MAG: helix-turn-helix domain-containing protein [Bryobacterales bacterium]|nr:helix-turn-helix domain-containing protein [Bryobacterales bacterium]
MRTGHAREELIFGHIYDRRQCLRRELGGRFGLSGATISRAVALLLEKDLVVGKPSGAARLGRGWRPRSIVNSAVGRQYWNPQICTRA